MSRMQEHVAAHDALVAGCRRRPCRRCAPGSRRGSSVQRLAGLVGRRGGRPSPDALDAILGLRVRREPVGHAVPVRRLVDPPSVVEEGGHRRRIPAAGRPRSRRPADPPRARRRGRTSGRARRAPIWAEVAERADLRRTKMPPSSRPSDAPVARVYCLHGVARRDVADLVAQHAGQLRFVVQIRQDAARDVDVAAGQRERVDGRQVDDRELPRQVRPLRSCARAACPMAVT